MRVERPVWRRFIPRFVDRAAAWVRAGGHAAVQHDERHIDMLLGVDAEGRLTEAGLWSILALDQRRALRVKDGPGAGLMRARAAPHATRAVLDWCDRDSMLEGPTRRLELACLDCGACCQEANVLLDDDDLERFRAGGRADLTRPPYVRRARDGKVTLRFAKDGRCQHLAADNKCHIYSLRPFNCSVFPVGSEACLAAREATLGIRDDAQRRTSRRRTNGP
ncbi:MAG: YkgJ family cysteine cluster protein [Polyangiaceae bacterium]|jgi:Fe-S-cluster containining protein|nr:YkgJ family cysteine cluster protein [Polyangiaceae bacterium]MBK8936948.1 YkgJ family cysteine cluster protein [Polyangiaceae bacterium]